MARVRVAAAHSRSFQSAVSLFDVPTPSEAIALTNSSREMVPELSESHSRNTEITSFIDAIIVSRTCAGSGWLGSTRPLERDSRARRHATVPQAPRA